MYAILFQCVLVQALCQGVSFAVLLWRVFFLGSDDKFWDRIHISLSVAFRQFYEVTWACVTHLRYVQTLAVIFL